MQVKTIERIVASLPSGFEDCFIHALHFEVASRSAYLDIAVIIRRNWGGASELRTGRLSAINVHVSFVEPPAPAYPFLFEGKAISASLDLELNGMNGATEQIISSVPNNAEVIRLFLHDWNSFLYLAADAFTFTWLEQETTRTTLE
jgi:hypothetical protein